MDVFSGINTAKLAMESGDFPAAEHTLFQVIAEFGETEATLAGKLKERMRIEGIARVEADISLLEAQNPHHAVVKLLRVYMQCVTNNLVRRTQLDALERTRRIALKDDRSHNLLCVNINIPITTCNYRCEYCFLKHDIKPDLTKLDKVGDILAKLSFIPRPLGITLTPAGEVLAVPKMWHYLGQAAALKNVAWVEVWSNLSRDPELLFAHVDPAKLCLIATYHPTEFKEFDTENEAFFARLWREPRTWCKTSRSTSSSTRRTSHSYRSSSSALARWMSTSR